MDAEVTEEAADCLAERMEDTRVEAGDESDELPDCLDGVLVVGSLVCGIGLETLRTGSMAIESREVLNLLARSSRLSALTGAENLLESRFGNGSGAFEDVVAMFLVAVFECDASEVISLLNGEGEGPVDMLYKA